VYFRGWGWAQLSHLDVIRYPAIRVSKRSLLPSPFRTGVYALRICRQFISAFLYLSTVVSVNCDRINITLPAGSAPPLPPGGDREARHGCQRVRLVFKVFPWQCLLFAWGGRAFGSRIVVGNMTTTYRSHAHQTDENGLTEVLYVFHSDTMRCEVCLYRIVQSAHSINAACCKRQEHHDACRMLLSFVRGHSSTEATGVCASRLPLRILPNR